MEAATDQGHSGRGITWSETQLARLRELRADPMVLERTFTDAGRRNEAFHRAEKELVKRERQRLDAFREEVRRPLLCRLRETLVRTLTDQGFVQVTTPTLMARGLLARMGISGSHPLMEQIFWVDGDKCLRPMLAPHLYFVLRDLLRLWERPVRLFEVGSCFRKETRGARHAAEFTMLNLVEMGLPLGDRQDRFRELAGQVMAAAGIASYRLETVGSAVYRETVDIVSGEPPMEVASGAFGPHPLDEAWRIHEPWVGIGFGLERLIMVAEGLSNLGRAGRSLIYLNGVRLNI